MKWRIPHFFCLALVWLALLSLPVVPEASASGGSIRLSIAFSPGGALDAIVRTLAREAEKDYEVLEEIPFWSNGGGFTSRKRARPGPSGGR